MKLFYQKTTLVFLLMISNCFAETVSPWHFNPTDVNSLHSKSADHRIYYGSDPHQFGDLRLPKGSGPYPVVILLHGGCWKSTFANVQNTSALADALRDIGVATWNIEYRSEDNRGGGWPGTFNDVATGADYLRIIATQYSLDLDHVIVVGHSAGGHLALWLAARHRLPATSQLGMQNPIRFRGVIALGGVPDLKAFQSQAKITCGSDVIGALLGVDPVQVAKHYKEASPMELLPLGLPQILIYGAEDESVPASFGYPYLRMASTKGDDVKLIKVNYAAHHEYIVPNSVTWPVVRSAVLSLLR